ncbi:MAG: tlpA2 [Firmicutes bacterium]|nr:tlpA2 [Bacillota bacterium]
MRWLSNMKVFGKLLVIIVVAIISLGAVGITGYHYLSKANADMDSMYKDRLLPVQWLNDSRNQAKGIESDLFDLMLTVDNNENKRIIQDMDKRVEIFGKNLADYEKTKLDSFEVDTLKKVQDSLGKYRTARKEVIELAMQNKNAEAYEVYNKKVRSHAENFHKGLGELADYNAKAAEKINKESQDNFIKAMWLFAIIMLMSVVLVLVIGWLITRYMTAAFDLMTSRLTIMAQGEFSKPILREFMQRKDEFGVAGRCFESLNINMQNLIKQLSSTSEQLAASSEELTASAEQSAQAANQVAGSITQVAQGAEKQLNLVASTTDVVEQMSQGIEQVAEHAQTVSSTAEKTASAARDGEMAIEKAVEQMSVIEEKTSETAAVIAELEGKSKEIGQIVEVIASIAGQTNLLALNAAIEAARAGEQGRGFAVVAEEVRKLAEQSGEAAKKIANLIGEVQQKTNNAVVYMDQGKFEVSTGTQVVNLAGDSFREIMKMIQQMSEQIHEISVASEEINSGSQRVVSAVREIDKESKNSAEQSQTVSAATEEQSASMEEIASSSQALSAMAEELQTSIRKFKV